jgi:hypothetical protein
MSGTGTYFTLTFVRSFWYSEEMEGYEPPSSEAESPSPLTRELPEVKSIEGQRSVADALEILGRTTEPALPILGETGEIIGWVSRQPPVLVVPHNLPDPSIAPPRLGGMATPLGVYLTDGFRSGGAGFWGLFLTGMLICSLGLVSQAILHFSLLLYAHAAHQPISVWINSHPPAIRDWLSETVDYLPLLFVFIMLRLIPLSGTHAAEHQVVHCIEQGMPLVKDQVRAMPRVHPRCGTNLIVGLSLFLAFYLSTFCIAQAQFLSVTDSAMLALVIAAPIAASQWRRIGGIIQQWLATKPATDKQIASGIWAAEQLFARRQNADITAPVRFYLLRRIWFMGFVQLLMGYAVIVGLVYLAMQIWPLFGNFLEN